MKNKLIKHFIKQQPTDNTEGVLLYFRFGHTPNRLYTLQMVCEWWIYANYFIQIPNCALITYYYNNTMANWLLSIDIKKVFSNNKKYYNNAFLSPFSISTPKRRRSCSLSPFHSHMLTCSKKESFGKYYAAIKRNVRSVGFFINSWLKTPFDNSN